jgi:hypothetical protein
VEIQGVRDQRVQRIARNRDDSALANQIGRACNRIGIRPIGVYFNKVRGHNRFRQWEIE